MDNSLYHHGTKGQRWGVRRYQNPDGTLTPAGKKRYAKNNKNTKQEKPKELTPEEKKAKIVKDRSAKSFYENRKMFTYDETKSMRQLLQEDELIKKMIVEEPSKVKKFLDKTGEFATSVKNIVVPVVDTLKKLNEIAGSDSGSSSGRRSSSDSSSSSGRRSSSDSSSSSDSDSDSGSASRSDRSSDSGSGSDSGSRTGTSSDSGSSSGRRSSSGSGSSSDSGSRPGVSSGSSSSSGRSLGSGSDIYDVDFRDITDLGSRIAGSLGGSSSRVSSIPTASSETRAFIADNIAGYLPGPKEDD